MEIKQYQALATDYDGTIATHSKVSKTTIAGLDRWQKTGRKLILVTGRRLDSVYKVFPEIKSFDCIVAENGALIYFPNIKEKILLGESRPESLIETLKERKVEPLKMGEVIVSTLSPHEKTVGEVVKELGLSWEISLNKGAVMLLPKGVNKDTGLKIALDKMNISPDRVVGVGDAENDLPLLSLCGLAVSVNNALPVLKDCSDWVMTKNSGDGVVELIDKLINEQLAMSN